MSKQNTKDVHYIFHSLVTTGELFLFKNSSVRQFTCLYVLGLNKQSSE